MHSAAKAGSCAGKSKAPQGGTTAPCLDLDHFKTVNDSLGHAAGDELLRQAGARLSALVRGKDSVCHLGGDEFLVLLGEIADADGAAVVATKVLDRLAAPFFVHGVEVTTAASIGIAVCPDDGNCFDEVLKSVDIAMYQAKNAGGHAFRFFDSHMNAGVMEHTALLAGMRAGFPRGEFQVHYQPQFDLASGHLVGAEALSRWRHPALGAVSPARFIPVAERSGFIVELGAWVLREACRQTDAWGERLGAGFRVSVNLSPVQFRHGEIEHVLLNALEAAGLPPQRLEVELTESMLLEDSRDLRGALERLRRMGTGFAIDDFGTGYSNLGYLKRFEVGRLKIDQSFVRRLTLDAQDQAIVGAIAKMAKRLGLTTIAEGRRGRGDVGTVAHAGLRRGSGVPLVGRPVGRRIR